MQQIYLASIKQVPCDFEMKLGELNEQRRTKVLRCKNITDKKRSYLAGRLLSHAVQQAGIDEATVRLAPYDWEEIGHKKQDMAQQRYYANISHSGEYVTAAISDNPIGVDIEQYGTRYGENGAKQSNNRHSDALARRVLSAEEYVLYRNLLCEGDEAQKNFFLKMWTRKEAYAKWTGKGIAMDFSKIDALCEQNFSGMRIDIKNQDFLWIGVYPADAGASFHTLF